MNKSGIYLLSCMKNGNQYVGSSSSIYDRKGRHLYDLRNHKHCNKHLQHVYDKYGEESITFRVLLYCNPKNLTLFEQRAIDVIKPNLNLCPVAGSILGLKSSKEACEHIRQAKLNISAETRAKLSASAKKVVHKPLSPETRAKIGLANIGKHNRRMTTEQKKKISELTKIGLSKVPWRVLSAESLYKIGCANRGKPMSDEQKKKLSIAHMGKYRGRVIDKVDTGSVQQIEEANDE